MKKLHLVIILFLISIKLFSQSASFGKVNNISMEFNTAVVLFNAKISSEFDYYKNQNMKISLQPGVEYISSGGVDKTFYNTAPYYEFNLLGIGNVFYNSSISPKPFLGIAYRINSNRTKRESYFTVKYGVTLNINVTQNFALILKAMYVQKESSRDVPILFGFGFILFKDY